MPLPIYRRRVSTVLVLTLSLILGVGPADYEITRWTVDSGGVTQGSTDDFELSGTIGQPDAGVMTGAGFELTGGFWFGLAPSDCNDDGHVSGLDVEMLLACLQGPAEPVGGGRCPCFDVDNDEHVTLSDYRVLQNALTQP